jgi:peptidoglycan/xylan/chitin deacetylase (PgdA/CDA1 family)
LLIKVKRRDVIILFALICIVIFLNASSTGLLIPKSNNSTTLNDTISQRKPMIVLRIDDIQDFAFKDGQDYLLNYHAVTKIPVDLAVIPAYIGNDPETMKLLKKSIEAGAEVSAHGWIHEDLSKLDETAQIQLLTKSRLTLKRLFGIDVTVMVSPMYFFNNATLSALKKTGYKVLSSDIGLGEPETLSNGVLFIPSTVQLSDEVNNTWIMKNNEVLKREVESSVAQYGYAVIVLHPQEFLTDNHLSPEAVMKYEGLVQYLNEKYTLTDFHEMMKGL